MLVLASATGLQLLQKVRLMLVPARKTDKLQYRQLKHMLVLAVENRPRIQPTKLMLVPVNVTDRYRRQTKHMHVPVNVIDLQLVQQMKLMLVIASVTGQQEMSHLTKLILVHASATNKLQHRQPRHMLALVTVSLL